MIHTSWISRGVVGGLLSSITFSALVNLKGCNAFKKLWTVSSDWWLQGVSWRYRIVWNMSLIISIVKVCVCVCSYFTCYGASNLPHTWS